MPISGYIFYVGCQHHPQMSKYHFLFLFQFALYFLLACNNRWPPHFFPQYQEQEAGIIFPRTLPQNVSLALSDFTEAFTEKEQASSYGALLQNKDFATSRSGCQSAVSLFFALKRDSLSGDTTQSAPPRDFSGTEGCICRTNSALPLMSSYHPANCPLRRLP